MYRDFRYTLAHAQTVCTRPSFRAWGRGYVCTCSNCLYAPVDRARIVTETYTDPYMIVHSLQDIRICGYFAVVYSDHETSMATTSTSRGFPLGQIMRSGPLSASGGGGGVGGGGGEHSQRSLMEQ